MRRNECVDRPGVGNHRCRGIGEVLEIGGAERTWLREAFRFSDDVQTVGEIAEGGQGSVRHHDVSGLSGIPLLLYHTADRHIDAMHADNLTFIVQGDGFHGIALLEQVDPLRGGGDDGRLRYAKRSQIGVA